ncbi:ABC exporter membrane fusion protein [Anabaena minutissima FACHB-250]|nr:ABC exporter membrane fusion protein [Anabaena minutissima FACHB-250]
MKSQLMFKSLNRGTTALIIISAVATGAITTYSVLSLQSASSRSTSTTVNTKINDIGAIAATGYLEPQDKVITISAPAFQEGARVTELLVKRGDKVKSGQVIAILDSRDRLQASLRQAQVQVKVAQARLQQVKAGAKRGEITAQDARFEGTQAELKGQIATQRATIASLKAKLQGEKIAQEATIERIKAELRNSQTDCERYQSLYQDGAVAAQQRDSFCLQQDTTQERLKEAQANLSRIVSSYQEDIEEATANLRRTVATNQKQIKEAEATLDSIAEVRPVDVQLAQMEVAATQATVQRARADLELAYVRSPRDGQILQIHSWPGELIGNQGIVDLGNTDQMYITAEVYETDITKVNIGQIATIKGDRVIGELQGTVDEIGLQIGKKDALGTDPVADADARVVEVKIRLDAEASQRVAGLTNLQVKVVINTSNSPESTSN